MTIDRRTLLGSGAVLTGTALGGAVAGHAAAAAGVGVGATDTAPSRSSSADVVGPVAADEQVPGLWESVAFHGDHQAGVLTDQQRHATFLGLDLAPKSGPAHVRRLLGLLTDDAARLTAGLPPLGALEPASTIPPARTTITFGFGPGLFDALRVPAACPPMVRALPAFATDRLLTRWGQSDLLLQVCAEDTVTLAYAVRRLVRDARSFASLRWVQHGFVDTPNQHGSFRNLMGMRDGSANEQQPSARADVVWSKTSGPLAWLTGGSQAVVRRMRIDLDRWDDIEVPAREAAFGRRIADGAPLTGSTESEQIDRAAVDADGFTIIPRTAHAALAQARTGPERMLRRAYNYDDGPSAGGVPDAGLIFVSYQADLATAFVPVQRRLAQADALNVWAVTVGSAAYAIPPGVRDGEVVGATLLAHSPKG